MSDPDIIFKVTLVAESGDRSETETVSRVIKDGDDEKLGVTLLLSDFVVAAGRALDRLDSPEAS